MRELAFALLVGCTQTPVVASESLRASAVPLGSPNVEIIVGPSGSSGLLSAIAGATQSVHMLMYLLTDDGIIGALLERNDAGLDVRVVLNKEVPQGVDNTRSFQCLQSRGVPVVWAPEAFDFNHSKTVVLDGRTAWIMTMNASRSSLSGNREYLAVDTTPADVAESEALFAADFAGKPFEPQGALVISPLNSRQRIVELVNEAEHTIDISAEQLIDYAFVQTLCAAAERGVRVRALTDGDIGNTQLSVVKTLAQCGVPVFTLDALYVHAKALVMDGRRAYVGSINYTKTSMDYNREVGIVTDNAAAVQIIADTIDGDMAAGRLIEEPVACSDASACAAGQGCLNKFCQPYCSDGAQCQAGEVCVLEKNSSYGACQTAAQCTSAAECGTGLVCHGSCAHCASNDECDTGLCDRSFCKKPTLKCTEDPTVCKGATPACDATQQKCVGCTAVTEFTCPNGTACAADVCSRTYGYCL